MSARSVGVPEGIGSTRHDVRPRASFGRRDPDARGYFGDFGGRFVPETLVAPMVALEAAYADARRDDAFVDAYEHLLREYVGRPTPLFEARRISEALGLRVFLKREDLAHTGAHKINNALGQALLARADGQASHRRRDRRRAARRRDRHGLRAARARVRRLHGRRTTWRARRSTSSACGCSARQVVGVDAGSRTLKDAINEAMRDWVATVADTHYLLGSALGPHPYPLMVREFQSVIGAEARAQILDAVGRLPDAVVACVGGGSNAMGIFDAFIDDRDVRLIGVEAGGEAIVDGRHAARFAGGQPGVLQGTRTFVLQDEAGNIQADALGVGGPRLRRRRTRARVAAQHRAHQIRLRH